MLTFQVAVLWTFTLLTSSGVLERRDMVWERLYSRLEFEESSEGVMNTTGSVYT